jgi:putative nucleotidyltransferase with HDIG domain
MASSIAADTAALEGLLESPSTPEAEALAHALMRAVVAIGREDPPARRHEAVRALLAVNHQLYRTGDLRRCGEALRHALALAHDLEAGLRISVLLRCGDFDMLRWDVAAALRHTNAAMELAHGSGHRVEEARALVNFGMALDFAGLYDEADRNWEAALGLLDGLDEPRLRGNIWALRAPLGFRLKPGNAERADRACREALDWAIASPPRFRDSMACTALCNWAALDLQRGRLESARARLAQSASYPNVGVRPLWLVEVLRAMADIRSRPDATSVAALEALLEPSRAPAAAYVIETVGVLAAMYADMGDAVRAGEALARLSSERARALWAMLRDQAIGVPDPADSPGRDPATALLERLAVTAELRDDATGKHCYRVGRLAMLLARRVGVPEAELPALDLAARLHDIGKLVIPDAILLKPGRLDATEMHLMRAHTTIGAEILASGAVPSVHEAAAIARHHHEHWDGSGYPDGLAGEAIPLAARVAALADVYDALTHARPYKHAWSHEEAVAYIARCAGTQFDPRLAASFLEMVGQAGAQVEALLRDVEPVALLA